MAKKAYIGIGDKARTIKNTYVGVGDKARKVIKAYVGDENGKAKQWWPSIVKVTKRIFDDFFNYYSHFVWARTNSFSLADTDNTKYYMSSSEYGIYLWMFTSYNTVDDSTGAHGSNSPLMFAYGTGEFATKNVLKTRQLSYSGRVHIFIPTLMFGVSKLQFVLSGGSTFTIVRVGAGIRVQDKQQEIPDTVVTSIQLQGEQNVTVSLDCDDIRVDYIYLQITNSILAAGSITLNRITATYERTYGIVNNTLPPIGQPYQPRKYYLNYPKSGYLINGGQLEFNIISASSAVWLLVFNSDNCYDGDHVYADVTQGDYWGTGNTFFIFISKDAFVIKREPDGATFNPYIVTYGNDRVYWYHLTVPPTATYIPLHNYAYTRYEGWNQYTDLENLAARMGYNLFYAGLPIE